MLQVVQNFKSGHVSVEEVPRPLVKPGYVLVRNLASLISTGTEGSTVRLGKKSLLGKARARPDQAAKVVKAFRSEGVVTTIRTVRRTLDLPIPLGYSCAGVVEAVGQGVSDLRPGDRVACGGGGMAQHASFVVVPRNLCAPIPEPVDVTHAAFTTLGAIAMQSVRIAEASLGENVVVIGLGLVGLLTVDVLRAAGCNVIGIDVNRARVDWVNDSGICNAICRSADNLEDQILEATAGVGADSVIITAGVPNNDPVALAGVLSRKKGRVVVVGRTVMDAPRETYLMKELELRTSFAYGPGAADPDYELNGQDYPLSYVRWTENRNMQCFLQLLANGRLSIERLVSSRFPIERAAEAFDVVAHAGAETIAVVLDYPGDTDPSTTVRPRISASSRPVPSTSNRLRLGVVGAGSFATNVMLPLLTSRRDAKVSTIASASGINAAALAGKYGIRQCTSDANEMVAANDLDAVFIFTRHGDHARLAEQALRSGKHVFVEKPLALNAEQLDAVVAAQRETGRILMVGFNRPFSPLAQQLKTYFADRVQPMAVDFRGSVGYRPPEHWLHDPVDGGGVILGEACHYIDFCRWLVDRPIAGTEATCLAGGTTGLIPEDNAAVTLSFDDGSLARIWYLSNGAVALGRERCEVHAEQKTAVWEDFRSVRRTTGLRLPRTTRHRFVVRKGYTEELDAFFAAIRAGGPADWLDGQIDASAAAIRAAQLVTRSHEPQPAIAASEAA